MDSFNVPKKINRHVLKAINFLSDGKFKKPIPAAAILNQVKYQMRNLVPVASIDMAVENSLENLSGIGLIKRVGPKRYALGRSYATPQQGPSASSTGRRIFRADSRKRNRIELNPNVNRAYQSEESLSGDEFDRTRKRLRTNNKQINYSGRSTELPKARQHRRQHVANDYALDNPLYTPGDFGVNYFSDLSLNQNPGTCNFVNMDRATLDNAEIKYDNSDSFCNLQREDKIPKKSSFEIIQLYPSSKSYNEISKASIATHRDNKTNNSVEPSSETVNSPSVTTKKSNLVEDSNLCIRSQPDITTNNSVEPSSETSNSKVN